MLRHQTQRGLSLVELMVALVVSLVLMAGVSTVYLSSKRSYQTRDQLAQMDATARVALTALSKHLQHAGYATPNKLPLGEYLYMKNGPQPPKAACNGSGTGVHSSLNLTAFAARGTQDNYSTTGGDAIGVRLLGDEQLFTDCANGELPAGCRAGTAPTMEASLIYNLFFVEQSNGQPTLMCHGSRHTVAAPVAPGVENIQFLYGVDDNGDDAVDRYVAATNLTATSQQQVISIRIGLLVRALEPTLPTAESRTYQVLDQSITRNDRFQRAVYTTVIHLRNVVDS